MAREGVFLTDFGLARDTATGSRYTRTGTTLGTPSYMSPEQARGDFAALTPASDVWSLGCVLFELQSGGRRAFDGPDAAAVIGAVMTGRPAAGLQTPPPVARLVAACLARAPSSRPATAARLAEDLARVARGQRPHARAPRGRRTIIAAVGLPAVAALAAGLAWRAAGRTATPAPAPDVSARAVRLAERAQDQRHSAPRESLRLLTQALDLAPARTDWRLQLGLWHWALGDAAQAHQAWARVPDDAAEGPRARLYEAIELIFRPDRGRLRGPEALPALQRLAAAGGPEGRLAEGAAAVVRGDWASARTSLAGQTGWVPALLRAMTESAAPGGDWVAAQREYGIALESGIPFAWVHSNRAVLRSRLDDLKGTLADLDSALGQGYDPADVLARRGWTKGRLEDFRGALADFDRALELNPGNTDNLGFRGQVKGALGDFSGALADLDRALALAPDDPWLHHQRARTLHDGGRFADAVQGFDRTLALAGVDDPDVLHARGWSRHRLGDLEGAAADYDRALAVAPNHTWALNNRGVLRMDRDEWPAALADLDRAIAAGLEDSLVHSNRGRALTALGDLAGALAAHEQALRLNPRNLNARNGRGLVRLFSGQLEPALEDFAALLEADPGYAVAHVNLAFTHLQLGHLTVARAHAEQGVEGLPTDALAFACRALVRLTAGDVPGALADGARAVEVDDRKPEAHGARGLARLAAGQFANAAADLERALALAPPGWTHRARAQASLAQARAALQRRGPDTPR